MFCQNNLVNYKCRTHVSQKKGKNITSNNEKTTTAYNRKMAHNK